jgi:DNA helicase II / ATP-dependent DNA helicase PcrA
MVDSKSVRTRSPQAPEAPVTIANPETSSIDLLAGLNEGQRNAVSTIGGPVLVVAGPGSGKTRVLTNRIAHLIQDHVVSPNRILAVTFTNKAAREMKDRVERLVGSGGTEGLTMGTFHSLGVRLLRQNPGAIAMHIGLRPNFTIYDDSDQQRVAKQAILDLGLDPKSVAPRRMTSRISAAKSLLLTPDEVATKAATYDDEIVSRVYREYQRQLSRSNSVDFDDLLVLPIRLFDAAPELLERYQDRFRYVLVDEYQDTNRVQYILISALSGKHRNLFVVGDPDQSIYGWRQADIRNILDFEHDFPDARRIDLEINYRSSARIVAVADQVIRENAMRIDRILRTDNDDGERVSIRELSDQNHEAQFVVDEIRRLIASGRASSDDIAVMYRTTAQSRVLEEAFRTSDIPYQIVGGVRFYDRKEVKDVLAVFRLLVNPADAISLERVLENLPIGRGLGPKAIDTIRTWSVLERQPLLNGFTVFAKAEPTGTVPELSGVARSAATRFGDVMLTLTAAAETHSLAELHDLVLERTGYQATFDLANEEAMERWANILELRSDLTSYDALPPGEALPTYLEQVALIADIDALSEEARRRVTLITLHSAKGLEFPVVFITGLEDGLLPISRALEAEFTDPMPLEEERRLFYVGITRAERLLYLTHAGTRMTYGRYQSGIPSRFLMSLPQEHVRDLGSRMTARSQARSSLASQIRRESSLRTTTTADSTMGRIETPNFRIGDRVFHPKFGEGQVLDVVARNADQELNIEFARHGQKRLLASLAPLDRISE